MANLTIKPIDDSTELNRMVNRLFDSIHQKGFIEMGPGNVFMIHTYASYYETVKKFQVYDNDIFINGFPKSGTRWAQEMIWLIGNNLDFESAKQTQLRLRSPVLEFDGITTLNSNLMEKIVEMKSPRFIKTHLHWNLWPEDITSYLKKPKIFVIHRAPEDVCLSQFYQSKSTLGYTGTFDEFCTLFLAGKVPFGPYWNQVLSIWEQRNKFNMMFITYKK